MCRARAYSETIPLVLRRELSCHFATDDKCVRMFISRNTVSRHTRWDHLLGLCLKKGMASISGKVLDSLADAGDLPMTRRPSSLSNAFVRTRSNNEATYLRTIRCLDKGLSIRV